MNLYQLLSFWRDAKAAQKGPTALGRRLIRKRIYGRALRGAGLLTRLLKVSR